METRGWSKKNSAGPDVSRYPVEGFGVHFPAIICVGEKNRKIHGARKGTSIEVVFVFPSFARGQRDLRVAARLRSVNLDVRPVVFNSVTGHFRIAGLLVRLLGKVTANRPFDKVGTLNDGERPLGNHDQSDKGKELGSEVVYVLGARAELRDLLFCDGFGELLAVHSGAFGVFADPVVDALQHCVDRDQDIGIVAAACVSAFTESIRADSEKGDEGSNSGQEEGEKAEEISHAEKEPIDSVADELGAAGAFLHLLVPAAFEDALRGDQGHESNTAVDNENSNQGPEKSRFELGDGCSHRTVHSCLEFIAFVVHHHRGNGDDTAENDAENRELPNGTHELCASAFLFLIRHCSFCE